MGVTAKQEDGRFESWAILEIMGHRTLGGFVQEVTIAGLGMLRIDLHGREGEAFATQFYPPTSVYCLSPATEAAARAVGERTRPRAPAAIGLLERPEWQDVHEGDCRCPACIDPR